MDEYKLLQPDEYLEQLVATWGDAVFNQALQLTRNSEDARDLCQDTFEHVYIALRREPGQRIERPLNWLYKIQKNIFINSLRKRCKSVKQSLDASKENFPNQLTCISMSEQSALLSTCEDGFNSQPDAVAESNEIHKEIYNLVKKLPPNTQQTMVLYLFEELSHSEIAKRLDKPLGTIKSSIHSGKVRLKELLILRKKEEI